jgi:hypothetical protein
VYRWADTYRSEVEAARQRFDARRQRASAA